MKDTHTIRVLILPASLAGETRVLVEHCGYTVAGQAADGHDALQFVPALRPDVILADLELAGEPDGLEMARRIQAACPTPIVALTAHDSPELAARAAAAGIGACLRKPPSARDVDRAISISIARFADGAELRRLNAELEAETARHRQTQAALRQSEERYRGILGAITDYIYTVHVEDGQAVETHHTPGCVAVTGYTSQEFSDDPYLWFRIVAPEDRPLVQDQAQRVLAGEAPVIEHRIIHKDGASRWIRNTPVLRRSGSEPGWSYDGLVQNITARKQAELALHASNETLRALFEVSPLAIVHLDLAGKVQMWNPAAERIFGWPAREVLGRPNPIVPNAQQAEYQAWSERVMQGQEIINQVAVRQRQDGALIHVSLSTAPLYDAQGRVCGRMAIVADITERKRAEAALTERELWLRESQRVAHIGTYHFDILHNAWQSTSVLDDIFGIDSAYDKTLQGWLGLVHPDQQSEMQAYFQNNVVGDRMPFDKEYRILRPADGQARWVHGRGELEFDAQGRPTVMFGTIQDITERKQAEEAIHQSEATLRSIFRAAPVGIGVTSQRVLKQVNERICQMTGYAKDELLEQSARMFYPSQADYDWVGQEKYRQIREHGTGSVETRWQHKDGRLLDILLSSTPLDPPASDLVIFTALDITDRKQVERALAESEARFRQLFDEAPIGYHEIDAAGRITRVNCTELAMLGYAAEDMLGRYVWEFIEEAHLSRESVQAKLAGRLSPTSSYERAYRRKDGTRLPVLVDERILCDAAGQVTGIRTTIQDITERQQAEESLRRANERLEATMDTLPDLLFEVDRDGRIYDFRAPRPEMLYAAPHEFLGKTVDQVLPQDAARILTDALGRAVEHGRDDGAVYSLPLPSGTSWFEVSIAARGDPHTMDGRLIVIARDITDRKRAAEQIKASLREKEVLLKEIHHRVKNNLQVVYSLLNLQAARIQDAPARRAFRESQDRIRSMALVHERLYQSQNLAKIDFGDYVQRLVTHLRHSYHTSPCDVAVNLHIHEIVLGIDAAIPCGLLINELVSNSLKHAFPPERNTPSDSACHICVSLDRVDKQFVLTVADNGIGFPPDLDLHTTESLGLELVVAWVEQLGGAIQVTRSPGTTFRITFEAR